MIDWTLRVQEGLDDERERLDGAPDGCRSKNLVSLGRDVFVLRSVERERKRDKRLAGSVLLGDFESESTLTLIHNGGAEDVEGVDGDVERGEDEVLDSATEGNAADASDEEVKVLH